MIAQQPRHRQIRRRLRRFSSMGGPASLPNCPRDSTTHQMSREAPHYLSSEQVGYVISQQHANKKVGLSADRAERRWCASTLYKLMEIPSWVITPYRRVRPDDPSYSTGPIICDLKQDKFDRYYGSFLQDINIVVLDGKHRAAEIKREHGDTNIEAFVGTECLPELRRWLEEYGPKRRHFVEALEAFYADSSSPNWHRLISAGREVGLRDSQLRTLWRRSRHGWLFSPALGEFVRQTEES